MNEARVRVTRAEAGDYRVELWDQGFAPPGTPPLAHGVFPVSHLDSTRTAAALDAIRNQLTPGAEFQAAGELLFDALRLAGIEPAWEPLRRAGVRTYLEIADPDLAALPWELLGVRVQGLFRRLFANPNAPILRAHPPGALPPLPLDATLRVLLLPGEPLTDDASFPANEFCAILRQFQSCPHCVHVEVAETVPADAAALAALLDAVCPHVIHFLGHGEPNPHTAYPALVFNAPAGKWWWDADAIYQQLSIRAGVPRLVVLNACHSSQLTGPAGTMTPVAGAFAAAGVPAVVAMQATVRVERALDFARAFYGRLVAGGAVDVAVAQARNSLGNADGSSGWARRDWALPVLSLAAPVAAILTLPDLPSAVANCPILGRFQATAGPAAFVGRTLERRALLGALTPFRPGEPPATCLILEGPNESGKSWLVQRCARDLAAGGMLVRHVDLTAGAAYDSVGLMERVLAGAGAAENPPSLVHAALPLARFADFQTQAAAYRAGPKDLSALRRVCEAWRRGLETLAGEQRMLIVLDQLRGSPGGIDGAEFKLALLSEVVIPIANNPQSPILLILVMRADDYGEYGLANVPKARRVTLKWLAPNEFAHLFYEFCRFKTDPKLDIVRQYCEIRYIKDNAWSPALFHKEFPDSVEGLV